MLLLLSFLLAHNSVYKKFHVSVYSAMNISNNMTSLNIFSEESYRCMVLRYKKEVEFFQISTSLSFTEKNSLTRLKVLITTSAVSQTLLSFICVNKSNLNYQHAQCPRKTSFIT